MEDFNSKYTGEQVEALLDQVASGNAGGGGGGITVESDPIFSASPAASITDAKKTEWDGKQDAIADLATIRSGAEKGATALQSIPDEYVTEDELSAKGYATTAQLGDKVDKVSGKGLSTEDFTSALKAKLEGLNNYDDTAIENALASLQTQFNTLVSGNASDAINSFNEIIAFLNGIEDSESLDSIIASIEQQIAGKMDKVTLATVATSGNYNDLSNKPTIPSAVTENTVSGWGFTKNTGTYSKPSGGIPKSDLASAVQTSLGKADTALQSYTEQYKGTITGVSANGTSVATSGVANIPAASTSKYGVTKLSSATNSTSTTLAATASAVKSAYDLADGKQDKLVSGTNIKTINGTSILGSGDITISGGGGGTSSNTGNEWVDEGTAMRITIVANKTHNWTISWDNYSDPNISFNLSIGEMSNVIINVQANVDSISIPSCFWANEDMPTFEMGNAYEISFKKTPFGVLATYAVYSIGISGTEPA